MDGGTRGFGRIPPLTPPRPMDRSPNPLARNVVRLSHLDLPGAGQVTVVGDYAYVGHIPNKQRLGTSILDVRDPKKPRVLSQISLEDPDSHSHKARVAGDIMIVNSERNMTPIGRRAEELPRLRARLRESLEREPSHKKRAEKLGIKESDIPMVEAAERNPYALGGFRIYDVSDRTKPKLLAYQKTGGIGVHRFDMDRSEERRVGEEGRSRWSPYHLKKKKITDVEVAEDK